MKLSELLERLEEDAERDAMLAQMVKNPETGQDITVKTALGYDKTHPARQAAAKIYAQFMAKKSAGKPAQSPQQTTPQQNPVQQATQQRPQIPNRQSSNFGTREFRRQQALKRMQQRRNPNFGSDDGYDAMRDRGAERGTWGKGRYYDPFYDPQDYR